ncbi:MAG: DMT family transporter [Proteobacteria bacterium]|nr:DMT family transporter [Pseudomonadota bacterium]MCP4915657.1 DMT family transporter [Pseudomonadota bacterium]
MSEPPGRLRVGALLGIGSAIAFTIMVAMVKVCREELDAVEIIHWRCLVAIPVAGLIAARGGFRIQAKRTFAIRLVLGFAAMVCFFTAAKGLPLANLALISRLQPILLALMAPLFLGASEKTGPIIWAVLAAGLLGCGFLVYPELQSFSNGGVYALWALGAAVFASGAHLALRALGRTDRPPVIVFWFQVGVFFVAGAVLWATGDWRVPPSTFWLPLAGVGLFATAGQLMMTAAYRRERAALVAATSYTSPLWGAMVDVAIFATIPGWEVAVGGTLVIAAGLTLVFRRT